MSIFFLRLEEKNIARDDMQQRHEVTCTLWVKSTLERLSSRTPQSKYSPNSKPHFKVLASDQTARFEP